MDHFILFLASRTGSAPPAEIGPWAIFAEEWQCALTGRAVIAVLNAQAPGVEFFWRCLSSAGLTL